MLAIDWMAEHPMPTRRDESWRYTAVDELLTALHDATEQAAPTPDVEQILALTGDHGGPRLVLVNGAVLASACRLDPVDGLALEPVSTAGSGHPAPAVLDGDRTDGFLALNWRAGTDGASIEVAPAATIEHPIHVVHVAAPTGQGTLLTHPSTVLHLGAGAQATVIESYVDLPGAALTNAATTIDIGDDATLTYHRVQAETDAANHVGHVRVRVGARGRFTATSFSIGATVSRVELDVRLVGDGAKVDLAGLSLPAESDRHDQVVIVDHAASHGQSNQRFRSIVDGKGRGSFTGHIIVASGVVDTDAHQTTHSLLLTRSAESDARPWLEILADDVRCTHGATVGRLDDAALFYLRSRGISEAVARSMLIDAFAREITDSVEIESLRDHLSACIAARQGLGGDDE